MILRTVKIIEQLAILDTQLLRRILWYIIARPHSSSRQSIDRKQSVLVVREEVQVPFHEM